MPNIDSAKKYMRVSAKKKAQNDEWRSKLANLERKFHKALKDKNKTDAEKLVKELQKTLDKSAKLNVVHKNNAARSKSRFVKALNKIK
jgi:small subunit ribosomal protein S20